RQRTLLAEAVTELKRVDQLRSALISTLGHDVRSPLTVIRGSIETILARHDRLREEDRTALLTSADRQARRLEALATDLLDLARLEAGRLDLQIEDLRVAEIVRNALSYIEDGNDFDVDVQPDLVARADPQRLEQILHNLAANAVRHGQPPFAIEAAQSDGTVNITVIDHGPGVSDDARPHLFEPFHGQQASGSVGYGLAIVSALVEAQGGAVAYEPNEPSGARFSVSLPAAA
ncbi:MAG: ATP-binding protein, partial [Actinomycetota bacterium]|nr:ATP-binding protein [Actinomycetota bacterium]